MESPCEKGLTGDLSTTDVLPIASVLAPFVESFCCAIADHRSWGINMSKARLRLIHCSDNAGSGTKDRGRDRSFRPLVLDGGRRADSAPKGNSWQAVLELFDLGLLVSQANYLAFLEASVAVFDAHGWAYAKQTD